MSKFDELVQEKSDYYDLRIVKEDAGPGMNPAAGGGMGSGMEQSQDVPPTPNMDSSPNPEQGATANPTYEKPYRDIAKLLYDALRINFEDLEQSAQRKILTLNPDDIKNDQQGVAILKAFERINEERQGPEPEEF